MKSSATAWGELQDGRNFGLVPYGIKRRLCFVEVNLLQETPTSLCLLCIYKYPQQIVFVFMCGGISVHACVFQRNFSPSWQDTTSPSVVMRSDTMSYLHGSCQIWIRDTCQYRIPISCNHHQPDFTSWRFHGDYTFATSNKAFKTCSISDSSCNRPMFCQDMDALVP